MEIKVPESIAIRVIVEGPYRKGVEVETAIRERYPEGRPRCVSFKPYTIEFDWHLERGQIDLINSMTKGFIE